MQKKWKTKKPKSGTEKVTMKEVKKAIKQHDAVVVEPKFCDDAYTTAFPYALGYEGMIWKILMPVQGTGDQQRIGDHIIVKNIHIEGCVLAYPGTSNIIRLILFKWHPDDGADPPAAATFLDSTGSMLSTSLAPFQMSHAGGTVNRDKYTIVKEKLINWHYYGGPNAKPQFRFTIKQNQKLSFRENNATTGKDMYYLFAVTDRVYSSQDQMKYLTRVVYTDQ